MGQGTTHSWVCMLSIGQPARGRGGEPLRGFPRARYLVDAGVLCWGPPGPPTHASQMGEGGLAPQTPFPACRAPHTPCVCRGSAPLRLFSAAWSHAPCAATLPITYGAVRAKPKTDEATQQDLAHAHCPCQQRPLRRNPVEQMVTSATSPNHPTLAIKLLVLEAAAKLPRI